MSRRTTALLAAGALAIGSLVVGPAAQAAPGVTATFAKTQDWGSGFEAKFTVANGGPSAISSWRVEFDLPAGTSLGGFSVVVGPGDRPIVMYAASAPGGALQRYVRWYREGYMSSTGSCFDIGNTTGKLNTHLPMKGGRGILLVPILLLLTLACTVAPTGPPTQPNDAEWSLVTRDYQWIQTLRDAQKVPPPTATRKEQIEARLESAGTTP